MLLHGFVRVLEEVLARRGGREEMRSAPRRGQGVVAGVGGRGRCSRVHVVGRGGGGRGHGDVARAGHVREPAVGSGGLVNVPPAGPVHAGRLLLHVLLELPRVVSSAGVHVRRLVVREVEIARPVGRGRGGRGDHPGRALVVGAAAQGGDAGRGRRGDLGAAGPLLLLLLLPAALLLPVREGRAVRPRAGLSGRGAAADGRGAPAGRGAAAGRSRTTGRLLPRMETFADGRIRQGRRTL